MKAMLPGGAFPAPIDEHGDIKGDAIEEYLQWDDWRVLGNLQHGKRCDQGDRLFDRNHYREIFHTVESPGAQEIEQYEEVKAAIGELAVHEAIAGKKWYKLEDSDVPVLNSARSVFEVRPLSGHSTLVGSLKPIAQRRLYVDVESQAEAKDRRDSILDKRKEATND